MYNEIRFPLDKNEGPHQFVYRPQHYPGPIAQDAIVSDEMREYHKRGQVQINLPKDFCFKKFIGEENASQEID
jgi:hypothetical protein